MEYIEYRIELTSRQREVLQLLVEGSSNRAIANALTIAESTVEQHVYAIFNKLGVDNRTAAAVQAIRRRLVKDETEEEKIEDSRHDKGHTHE